MRFCRTIRTSDVIAALEAAGWRWETLADGLEPVLTNAPPGQALCVGCGNWQSIRNYPTGQNGPCRFCQQASARRRCHGNL